MAAQLKPALNFRILMLILPSKSVREHVVRTSTRVHPSSLRPPMGPARPIIRPTSNERLTQQHPVCGGEYYPVNLNGIS